jgi:hypothetical protein
MFRKLVSNLAFSPALVGQLGFYAKRLKKEEATRRVGLIFTALALIVQSFAVFSPPEPANASSASDFIRGGVTSLDGYLHNYDANTNNIKDLFGVLGITRANIAAAKQQQINSKGLYSWGLRSHFSASQGEQAYTIKTSSGGTRTFYMRPLHLWDTGSNARTGSYYYAYVGKSSSGMWFALMKVCGNLVLKVVPPKPKCPSGMTGTYPNCVVPPKMCTIPGKSNLPASSPQCKPEPRCAVPGKTNLPANSPLCVPNPTAKCESLKITKIADNYQLSAAANVANGAAIKAYVYTIKKDGKVVKTQTVSSTKPSNTYTYSQKSQGRYTVELTVKTSAGDVSGPDCIKTFSIAAPQMCPQNPSLPVSSPECQPCPGDSTVWIKDETCSASVVQTKSASNTTQGNVDAVKTTAKAGDRIIYTLTLANHGKAATTVTPTEELSDVVEYADIIDTGSGTYSDEAKTLTWPEINLAPGASQTRMFAVQVYDKIPAMGQGVSDRTSYDCKMTNTFGNSVEIAVDCPVEKQIVEQTVAELPHTGPRENMLFAAVLFSIVAYFYARSRQMKKEIRLIRRDLNAGTI